MPDIDIENGRRSLPVGKRVVVTGMGCITSIGIGKDDFWKNLITGTSGISDVEKFDTSKLSVHRAGEIKNFKSEYFIGKALRRSIGRGSQFAIVTAKLALEDSKLDFRRLGRDNVSIIIGTTMGEAPSIEMVDRYWTEKGEGDIYISNIQNFPVNNLSDNVASFFNWTSQNFVMPTACAAGNYAIGYAFDLIRTGKKNLAVAGGVDPLSRLAFTGFNRLFAMAPEKCQPFDKNRKGMMLGEGGAILVIESIEHAMKRKANIYAEILGYGLSCDAFSMTIQSENGIYKAMDKAIKNSGINKTMVDYVSAHGTGTANNDKVESSAIKLVFGNRTKDIPVSSIKSMLGHTMGAASALEAIACCLSIRDGIIPPTINYQTPDSECDIDCVPNKAKNKKVHVALNNSFAFGGNNACVIFQEYRD